MTPGSLHPLLRQAMQNEVDYLVYIGASAGIILRYVQATHHVARHELAALLGISLHKELEMEHSQATLPEGWQCKLRTLCNS